MRKSFISKRARRRLLKVFLPLYTGALILVGIAYTVNAEQYKARFLQGTYVNNIEAGDLTPEELEEKIASQVASYELKMTFLDGQEESFTASDIGLRYVPQGEVKQLLDEQNRFIWIRGALGEEEAYTISPGVTYDEDAFTNIVNKLPELQASNVTEPSDAHLEFDDTNRLTLVPEVVGNKLDREALGAAVQEAVRTLKPELDLTKSEGVYLVPSVYADDEALNSNMERINRFLDTAVTFHMSDGTDKVLDASLTRKWLTKDENGAYDITPEAIAEGCANYIAELAAADDDHGFFRMFASTNFGRVQMETEEEHGHAINRELMTKHLISDLSNRKSAERDLEYSVMVDKLDPRFGGTYLEIDIINQRVYYYKNYELQYDAGCVTGLEGYRSTPSGVFDIQEKLYDTILEGRPLEDGTPSYRSHVNFFLRIYEGYGLHDASWRSSDEFGSSTYEYDGSHGCVNLPYAAAEYFYENVDIGTPVIIFRG